MFIYKEKIGLFCMKYFVPRPPKVEKDKIRVACIGDSITFGAGVQGKDYAHSTWEYFQQQKLGEDYQVLNYGISGRTMQNEGIIHTAKRNSTASRRKFRQIFISLCLERTMPSRITGTLSGTEISSADLWRFTGDFQTSQKSILWHHPSALWMSQLARWDMII